MYYTFQNGSGQYSISWINLTNGVITSLATDVKASGRVFRVYGNNLVYVRNGQSMVIDLTTLAVQTSVATNIKKAVISNGKLYSTTTANQLTVQSLSGDPTIMDLTNQLSSTIRQSTIFDGTLYILANDGVYYVDPATSVISRIRVIAPTLGLQEGSFFYAY